VPRRGRGGRPPPTAAAFAAGCWLRCDRGGVCCRRMVGWALGRSPSEVTTIRSSRTRVSLLSLSKAIDQGSLFASTLLVAWMLGPADFAALGALLVFNSLAVQVSNLGTGFVIYASTLDAPLPGRSIRTVRVAGVIAIAFGVGLMLTMGSWLWLAAGLLWSLSGEAYLRKAVALRADRITRVVTAEISGAALCIAVAIPGTAAGWTSALGAALVAKHVLELSILMHLRARPAVGRSSAQWSVFGGQAMTFVASNVDYLVVGLLLSSSSFSIYVIAFRLVSALLALSGQAITQDTFVRLATSKRSRWQSEFRATQRTALAVGVVGAVVGACGGWVGQFVLGASWADLGWTASALALAVPARFLVGPSIAVLVSSGHPGAVVRAEGLRALSTASAAALGSMAGLIGVGIGTALGAILGGVVLRRLAGGALASASDPPAVT
jgi:O-antigen/teichoic acid export membrane protein